MSKASTIHLTLTGPAAGQVLCGRARSVALPARFAHVATTPDRLIRAWGVSGVLCVECGAVYDESGG